MSLQALLCDLFSKGEGVTRAGKYSIERSSPDGAMVRMQSIGRRGIMGNHQVRFVDTHLAHQLAPQRQRGFDFTVGPAQECHFTNAQHTRGFLLFSLAYWFYFPRNQQWVAG